MPIKQPLAEVFGFPIDNMSPEAKRHRDNLLCPFNNKVPNCTKDKANDPLGVCSVFDGTDVAITCPIRFREKWIIANDAADFFFPPKTKWTSLVEIRLNDKHEKSAGNIDVVLVSYDDKGNITDFGSCEVQAVYISGNVRKPFQYYMEDPSKHSKMDWKDKTPHPDYLSSSRKRLAPQMIFKGGIFHSWKKKQAIVVDIQFFKTLPALPVVPMKDAEVAWLIYDLVLDKKTNVYQLTKVKTVYTKFQPALAKITIAEPGNVKDFVAHLQEKLKEKIAPPDAPTLIDVLVR